MITIPAKALYDVLTKGESHFYDNEQYRSYKVTVNEEPQSDSMETENEENGRYDLVLSKDDFMALMLDRHVKFENSFIKLMVS